MGVSSRFALGLGNEPMGAEIRDDITFPMSYQSCAGNICEPEQEKCECIVWATRCPLHRWVKGKTYYCRVTWNSSVLYYVPEGATGNIPDPCNRRHFPVGNHFTALKHPC